MLKRFQPYLRTTQTPTSTTQNTCAVHEHFAGRLPLWRRLTLQSVQFQELEGFVLVGRRCLGQSRPGKKNDCSRRERDPIWTNPPQKLAACWTEKYVRMKIRSTNCLKERSCVLHFLYGSKFTTSLWTRLWNYRFRFKNIMRHTWWHDELNREMHSWLHSWLHSWPHIATGPESVTADWRPNSAWKTMYRQGKAS